MVQQRMSGGIENNTSASTGTQREADSLQRVSVLHVVPQFGPGGTDRFLFNLLQTLDRERFCAGVCVIGNRRPTPFPFEGIADVEYLGFSGSRLSPWGWRRCIRKLRQEIRSRNATVVHSHLWNAARVAAVAANREGAQHIVHIHDTAPNLQEQTLRAWGRKVLLTRSLAGRKTSFIAVSEQTLEFVQQHLPTTRGRTQVILNGVDLDLFRPDDREDKLPEEDLQIGMIAWFFPFKGHDTLFRAVAHLSSRGIRCDVHLAGIGTLMDRFKDLASSLGIGEQVHFHGIIDDIPSFLRKLDVFVLPSEREGLPMSILEAMASGIPVVASAVGGIPEVIRDGHDGVLVPPLDPKRLATILERLALDSHLRKEIGRRGRESVEERFAVATVVHKIERYYDELSTARS